MPVDPDLAHRLIAESREDDERMTKAPWETPQGNRLAGAVSATINGMSCQVASACGQAPQFDDVTDVAKQLADNASAIARTRNNLASVAEQLEAALARVAELEDENLAQASQLLDPNATCCADASRVTKRLREQHVFEVVVLAKERNAAVERAEEVERFAAEAERVRKLHTLLANTTTEERDTALAEVARMRPVYEASKALHAVWTATAGDVTPEVARRLDELWRLVNHALSKDPADV